MTLTTSLAVEAYNQLKPAVSNSLSNVKKAIKKASDSPKIDGIRAGISLFTGSVYGGAAALIGVTALQSTAITAATTAFVYYMISEMEIYQ